ncbi:MAG: hypothetical protein SF187_07235 [Deltaproteobacteria bacterium]|nr:hypothetical protein [Deltaproteobacteria bacterium]
MAGSATNLCVVLKDGRATCMRGGQERPFPPFRVPDLRFSNLYVHEQGVCGDTVDGKPECFTVDGWTQASVVAGAKAAYPAPLATLSLMPDGHIEVRGHDWAKEQVPAARYTKLCGGGRWISQTDELLANSQRHVHACALAEDGHIVCWGDTPKVPPGTFVDILCGADFVCGLTANKRMICMNRKGDKEESEPGQELVNFASDGRYFGGALTKADERGWAVTRSYLFEYDGTQPYPEKGLFTAFWMGADSECGKRPSGETICWGRGVKTLQIPPSVKLPVHADR